MVDDDMHAGYTEILNSILEEWINQNDDENILSIYNLQLQRLLPLPKGVKYIRLCGLTVNESFEFPESLISIEMRYTNFPCCQLLPSNLLELKMLHANWETLPPLPISLQRLSIHYSKIEAFPEIFPPNLKYLYCSNLNISHIPILPKKLKALEVMRLPIKTLPSLPETIQYLDISYTNIEELPSDYWSNHDKLRTLYCNSMPLRSLPTLPPSLESLDCHETLISEIPSLPYSLKEIYCARTYIKSLPILPNNMRIISAYDISSLHTLPGLPKSLEELYIDDTQITYLELPPSLKVLDCTNCPKLLIQRDATQSIDEYREMWRQYIKYLTIKSCHCIKEELMMLLWSPESVIRKPWLLTEDESIMTI